MNRKLTIIPLLFLPLVALGCGSRDPSRLQTHPVEGVVHFEGRPLEGAFVVLHPKGHNDPKHLAAQAKTDAAGKFKPATYDTSDGAIAGEYSVTVQYFNLVNTADGIKAGPNVLPDKYANPATTDITIRVAEGENKIPVINITR